MKGSHRRLPVGAECAAGGVHFRVWAPRRRRVEVVLEGGGAHPLAAEEGGYFSGLVRGAGAGARYRYRLDGEGPFPDPASRFQPEGPHGPSEVIDPSTYRWRDGGWGGTRLEGQVIYEMHIGTFTPEGTYRAAAERLADLRDVGVTLIELMPLGDFPGRFGWGYDGVCLYAPTRLYGRPDELRALVDAAHALGIGVIVDVVYNHLGPDGNYLTQFSDAYFTDRYETEWGQPINFDGEGARPVRELFVENAGYWVDEMHMDGLRLDATQCIFDASARHILADIGARVRAAARGRATVIVSENEPQHTRLVRPVERGGYGLDALWNDDFHHSARVALTGRTEAYYTDHLGTPQELVSAVKWGYLFQGQRYKWQKQRRGTPAFDMPARRFVLYLENHDQVANTERGERLVTLVDQARLRAMTSLLLLAPGTPMLFQGQEYGSSTPFLYFADHEPDLARLVREGRADFLSQFPSIGTAEGRAELADPGALSTFEACKLDPDERRRNGRWLSLHRDLLTLRREDPVIALQRSDLVHGAVLGPEAFCLRYLGGEPGDRLLIVNLGRDVRLDPAPEPLLAPPEGARWVTRWSSESPVYGGVGTPELDTEENWLLPGHAAVLLAPAPARGASEEAAKR